MKNIYLFFIRGKLSHLRLISLQSKFIIFLTFLLVGNFCTAKSIFDIQYTKNGAVVYRNDMNFTIPFGLLNSQKHIKTFEADLQNYQNDLALDYCIPTRPQGAVDPCVDSSYITSVAFDGLSDSNIGCSPFYQNRTNSQNVIPNLVPESQYQLNLTTPHIGSLYLNVFIDFNQDGQFDYYNERFSGTVNSNFFITIPWDVMPGLTRMRIRTSSDYQETLPCSQYYYGVTLDYTVNMGLPECPYPSDLNVPLTGYNFALLGWTGTGDFYDIEWGLQGFQQGTGTMVTHTADNPYNITSGLAKNSAYSFFVRQNCGDGVVGHWVGPKDFRTENGSPSPWFEEFDTDTSVPGWDLGSFVLSDNAPQNNYLYKQFNEINNGTSPSFQTLWVENLQPNDRFKFLYSILNNQQGSGTIKVEVTDMNSRYWRDLGTINYNGAQHGWHEVFFDLNPFIESYYLGTAARFRITVNYNSKDYKLAFDSFSVAKTPACNANLPNNLSATDITGSSAQLNWDSSSDYFDIKYGAKGFIYGEGTVINQVEKPFVLAGLNPLTEYDYYVRARCNNEEDDVSDWAGPYSFKTTCLSTNPGTASIDHTLQAPDFPFTVSAAGYAEGVGITYQWWTSNDLGTTWTAIGQPSAEYTDYNGTTPNNYLGEKLQFKLKVACNYGGSFQFSNTVQIEINVTVCPNAFTQQHGVFYPECNGGELVDYMVPNSYVKIALDAGLEYYFWDDWQAQNDYFIITNEDGTEVLAYGLAGTFFNPETSGIYRVYINDTQGCNSQNYQPRAVLVFCFPHCDSSFSTPPPNVTIVNSSCQSGCSIGGGSITAPPASELPHWSQLQYSTDGGITWVNTIPVYNQNGPAQTIMTRIICLAGSAISPPSAPVTTIPGVCAIPDAPVIQVTDNICPFTDGDISISGCGDGYTLMWSTDGQNWSAQMPVYDSENTMNLYAKCIDDQTGCESGIATATTAPQDCSNYCTTTPNGGSVIINIPSGIPGTEYTVSATGYSVGIGITYQWLVSTDNGNSWQTAAAEIQDYADFTTIANNQYQVTTYKLKVNCSYTNQTAYSSEQSFELDDSQVFITEWYAYGQNSITIPTLGTGYDYTVYWEKIDNPAINGVLVHQTGNATISGLEPQAYYRIKISGDFPRIYFNGTTPQNFQIRKVTQWGNIKWKNFSGAFKGCVGLDVFAQDLPDLSDVQDLSYMFFSTVTEGLNANWNWDTGTITNMYGMFTYTKFNQAIDSWDVSQVIDMGSMFKNCPNFNQDLKDWDTSNVISFSETFSYANSFNQDISGWNTSKVKNFSMMFMNASAFNQNLGDWDLSEAVTLSFTFNSSGMDCENYGATLKGWAANPNTPTRLIYLDAVGVSYPISAMEAHDYLSTVKQWSIYDNGLKKDCGFKNAFTTEWNTGSDNEITIPTTGTGYNYDLYWQKINDPSVFGFLSGLTGDTTLEELESNTDYQIKISGDFPRIYFNNAYGKSKIKKVTEWGNIAWQSFNSAFYGCDNLEITATDTPDLTGVQNLSKMFSSCFSLTGAATNWAWNTQNITDMSYMFQSTGFNQDINNWDVSSVTDMSYMFQLTYDFNQDLSNWDVSNVENMSYLFANTDSFNQNIGNWNVSKVTNMAYMFSNAGIFNQNIGNWNVSGVTDMSYMFNGAGAFNQNLNDWNVSKVQTMHQMFFYAGVFNQNLDNWNLNEIQDMYGMFDHSDMDCSNYSSTITGWVFNYNTSNNVILGADGIIYSATASAAHDALINNKGWTINDGGMPAAPEIQITNNVCPSTEGNISSTGCGDNYSLLWSQDNVNWSETPPEYEDSPITVFAKCVNNLTGCESETAQSHTSPENCNNYCTGIPEEGLIGLAPSSGVPETSYLVYSTGYTTGIGLTYQWMYSTDFGQNWNPAGNPTPVYSPYNAVAPDASVSVVRWKLMVTCSFGGVSESLSTADFNVIPPAIYCNPTTPGGGYVNQFITNGGVINIDNSPQGSGPGTNGYSDFTNLDGLTVNPGDFVNFSIITSGLSNNGVAIWIDYNRDGNFSGEERVFYYPYYSQLPPEYRIIPIPSNISPGTTRMRILSAYFPGEPDPCSHSFDGEYEDYAIHINPLPECSGQPDAGVVSVNPFAGNPDSSYTVSAMNYSTGSNLSYSWLYSEDNGSTWQTAVSSLNYDDYQATAPSIIGQTVQWKLKVTCLSQPENPAESNVATFTSSCMFTIDYDVEPITNVTFAGINNSSSSNTSSPALEDFTDKTGVVSAGQNYPVSVKGNTNGEFTDYITVFIDWNQNGSLNDPGEKYEVGEIFNSTGEDEIKAENTITVPTDALQGATRMRVIKNYSSYVDNPCAAYNYGQAEDYSILVKSQPCYKPALTPESGKYEGTNTGVGITSLNRDAFSADDWLNIRKSGWLLLESKTKAFVLNRMTETQISALTPVEGMIVYDTTNECLKVYTSTDGQNFGWYCMNEQSCPE